MSNANPRFIQTTTSPESGHTISITPNFTAYSHCHTAKCNNELGQLGRNGDVSISLPITLSDSPSQPAIAQAAPTESAVGAAYAYTGGFSSSGHSAILDTNGSLWFSGCDRWQQLGLGSSSGGASGYTWKNGRLWQDFFQRNEYVVDLIKRLDPSLNESAIKNEKAKRYVRDVALGGDHTLILSSNRRDVISFGKGGEGQLGLSSKPWVSSPSKSKLLSSIKGEIAAVCAYRHCSFTLDESGKVMERVGKCSKGFEEAVESCRRRAVKDGLLKGNND